MYNPVRKFAVFNNSFQQALGASSQLFTFMDAEDVVIEKPRAKALPPFSQSVRFEGVCFSYQSDGDDAREILRDIDLEVKRGEMLAVVGSSGAGKSTLVHLLPRFFDVTSGRMLVDGHDVRDVTLASLRAQIGIVTQDTVLFNDTVRNNIAYGQPHVPLKDVEAAARAALAHDFILALPSGYDTVIGERGVRLSGGERQRLAIARALLKNAPILILDEATSALDSESEALVKSALHNLMSGRTVFVIAHRLSTVRRANRIVVIGNGTIAEIGAHEELMQHVGTYRAIFTNCSSPMPTCLKRLQNVRTRPTMPIRSMTGFAQVRGEVNSASAPSSSKTWNELIAKALGLHHLRALRVGKIHSHQRPTQARCPTSSSPFPIPPVPRAAASRTASTTTSSRWKSFKR